MCYSQIMKNQINTKNAPSAPAFLSQGIESGGFIFVSGQIHTKSDGTIVEGTVEEKLAQIMSNVSAILEAGGASLNDIVKVVIYVTDMAQMPALNAAYPTYFSAPFPVREAVCVAALPLGATIEISVITRKP